VKKKIRGEERREEEQKRVETVREEEGKSGSGVERTHSLSLLSWITN